MNKYRVLVTGGAGYIGSHTVVDISEHGFEAISADNFANSSPEVLSGIEAITGHPVEHVTVDLTDLEGVRDIFRGSGRLSGVIHFAALKSVGESVEKPLEYYHNNLVSLLNVLRCMQEHRVGQFIFSSSCSVYGQSRILPVSEETPLEPAQCPYARTKVMGEEIVRDFCAANPWFNAILLRYFNPAGAHPSALIGESSVNTASNLVPVITETAIGKRKGMVVHGTDYDTRDGSCIRDYIHVMDLANAHTRALQYILSGKNSSNCELFNLGIGEGVTVLEAIRAFEESTGQPLEYQIGPRRPGDVAAVYADYSKAELLLGWHPRYKIHDIMGTAWNWEKQRTQREGIGRR
jgi:UDP-glucose 4-epimerase